MRNLLRSALVAQWPAASGQRAWAAALVTVDRALADGEAAVARADWSWLETC